jgi:DNA-binding transcriptional MerR regulator
VAELPDKQYFRIGEVARILEVKPSVLRFWETEFRSVRPDKGRNGARVYSRRHVERLLEIRELLYVQGYTIAGARRRLREPGAEVEVPPPRTDTRSRETLTRVRREVEELLRLVGE